VAYKGALVFSGASFSALGFYLLQGRVSISALFFVIIGVDSVIRMNADLRDLFLYEVFLYYNPLLLVTMMVWLWGINLWVFSQSPANYAKIFDLDHTHLTHSDMWKVASFFLLSSNVSV
ncbi:hypothetical protein EJ110_NYTH53676, partial [Nymphaea thermarum]